MQRQASPTPSPQHLQCDSQALIALAVQITMAVAHKHTLPTSVPQPLQCDSEPVRTLAVEITMAVAHRDMLQTSVPQPLQCDSEPVRTLAAQITMALARNHNGSSFGGSGYCACHAEGSQRHQRPQRAPQPLLEALDTAPATRKTASGTSGDNARHSPFWRLWVYSPATRTASGTSGDNARRSCGYCACHEDSQRHQRRQRAPQPLLEALGTAPATRKTPSGTSGDNARRSPFWRLWVLRLPRRQQAAPAATTRAAAPSIEALGTAPATRTASGTSGDNARRSPFWRLWVLRLPRGRQPAAPAATTRAAAPSRGSGYCACHEDSTAPAATTRAAAFSGGSGYCACHEDSQRHQRRQRAPQALLEALDTAPATRKAGSGTSGDNARRKPFWRLWILRLPRRQPAVPAATTRAAAPSGGSGCCACHEDSQQHQRRQRAPQPLLGGSGYCACHAEGRQRHQRRQRAPQALLEALDTAPAAQTASGTSGDNARRRPFWRLWLLRLPRGQPAAPAATTRAAGPSGGSGYCACHAEGRQRHQRRQRAPQPLLEALGTAPANEDSKRHQRRQRAPQPLLEALGTAPATRKTASGTSGDNARRSPFWRLWVLRLPRGRQPAAPAATTRAAAPSGGSGYCACHEEDSQRHQRRQRAPQPLLEALGTAPATKTASGTSGDNSRRSPFWRLWVLRLPRGRQPAAPAATTRAAAPSGGSGTCPATTRAAAPSGGSGYCACHEEDSQRHQRRQRAPQPLVEALVLARRQRAPQPLLEALGTAPATKTASGTSGDNPRCSPFWRLWVLRLPRGRQPAAPAATTRAAAPSGGSGYCACHEDSQQHQRRQRAPQPLLGGSGYCACHAAVRLWVLRLPRGRQPAE